VSETITVKEAAAVRGQIAAYRQQQAQVTAKGEEQAKLHDAFTAALGVGVNGTAPTDVPESQGPAVRAQAKAAATKLGDAADSLETWLDGLTVIDTAGKTKVQNA
jgi:hypothetical protein